MQYHAPPAWLASLSITNRCYVSGVRWRLLVPVEAETCLVTLLHAITCFHQHSKNLLNPRSFKHMHANCCKAGFAVKFSSFYFSPRSFFEFNSRNSRALYKVCSALYSCFFAGPCCILGWLLLRWRWRK